jgi:nucleoside-diphosphate-sugar epimerase
MSKKTIIITGGTGFVGANLTRHLLATGHQIHLLVRPEYNAWRLKSIIKELHLHVVSLADEESLSRTIRRLKPDWIFHLATYGAYSWQNNFQQMLTTNILGTSHLVWACLKTGFDTFVNTGSSSEYGFKDHPTTEDELPQPNSHYAITKTGATLFCQYAARKFRVRIPTLRLYSVYGPYEEPRRLLPTLIVKGFKNQLPALVAPKTARDFVYVDDVVQAYLKVAANQLKDPGTIFNIGSGQQTTIEELLTLIRKILKIKTAPVWGTMKKRNWDTETWVANIEKAKRLLKWQPEVTFKKGVLQMASWFRQQPEILSFYEKNI